VRDHRKVLVVDGQTAFAGGLNIGDEYAPKEWGGANWHDVHLRIQGPAVRDIQKNFALSFRYASEEAQEPPVVRRNTPALAGHGRVQVLASDSRRGRSRIRRNYYFAMKRARKRILIQSAYFIPDRALRRVLRNATQRGVEVRVMVPRHSDVRAVFYAGRATYARLLRDGVRIYEWTPTILHAKVISIDGIWTAIGSYNLDRRSLHYNWELSLVVVDAATAATVERNFDADLARCEEVDAAKWAKRGIAERLLERVFYTFRKYL
jgi:cardiolipin synthase